MGTVRPQDEAYAKALEAHEKAVARHGAAVAGRGPFGSRIGRSGGTVRACTERGSGRVGGVR